MEVLDEDTLQMLNIVTKSTTDRKFKLTPDDAHKILSRKTAKDQEIMGIPKPCNLIISRLAVGPPAIRPSI